MCIASSLGSVIIVSRSYERDERPGGSAAGSMTGRFSPGCAMIIVGTLRWPT